MVVFNTKEVFKAKQELNKFLDKNPHMKEFQKEIEERLHKIGKNKVNRMTLLSSMMFEKVNELNSLLNLLANTCEDMK